jgi:regulator of PEP synthase PpsR (kinase-PPPase family)
MLTAMDDQLGMTPRGRPSLSYELQKEHFDRIDAVDFTLAHDDGQRAEELHLANVVLVGVSRASKSVTCLYLAGRGIRAANMPLLLGQKVPPELLRLGPKKVIGLTMNANRLRSIREARICRLSNTPLPSYVDDRRIIDELRNARALMSRHKWPCIDVSYMATEEVAHEVLSLIG